jgi:hypothetical protein
MTPVSRTCGSTCSSRRQAAAEVPPVFLGVLRELGPAEARLLDAMREWESATPILRRST